MSRYFIYLSYKGNNYSGWQVQPNAISVQECIEKAMETYFRQKVGIVAAGRTDADVHAREMIAHFDFPDRKELILNELPERLNRMLPKDIAIHKIVEVRPDAHARFDALTREYHYYITNRKDSFYFDYKWYLHLPLDYEKMNDLAKILFEYEDFTSFSKMHTDVKTNNCKLMKAEWKQLDEYNWVFIIKADRFLRNMVRAIVGTLLEGGRGRLDEIGFRRIIEAKNRCVAGASVPGHALFLEKIEYPDNLFLE